MVGIRFLIHPYTSHRPCLSLILFSNHPYMMYLHTMNHYFIKLTIYHLCVIKFY